MTPPLARRLTAPLGIWAEREYPRVSPVTQEAGQDGPGSASPLDTPAGRGRAFLPDPGKICRSGNFPRPGVCEISAPIMDKKGSPVSGSHRARSASSPASSRAPGTAAPTPRAEHHGPRRDRRRRPLPFAPPGRAAAAAPGRLLPARSW